MALSVAWRLGCTWGDFHAAMFDENLARPIVGRESTWVTVGSGDGPMVTPWPLQSPWMWASASSVD